MFVYHRVCPIFATDPAAGGRYLHAPRQRPAAAPAERQAPEASGKRCRVHETTQCHGSGWGFTTRLHLNWLVVWNMDFIFP